MTFSMRRFRAMVTKEWKDAIRNPQILLNAGMPILLAVLLNQKELEPGDLTFLAIPILVAISITGAFVQATLIAEEKEKNTLRALMLSPASRLEVLAGKSATTTLFAMIVIAACIIISGVPDVNIAYLTILSILLLLIFMALGTVIGLIARTASESSIVGLPILLFFIFGPIFVPDLDVPALMNIINWLPSHQFVVAVTELVQDGGLKQIQGSLFNLIIWTLMSGMLCFLIYGKQRFDK
ncbi:ABC-2 type transport system permease protein [Fontibacillus phaseoli]|uniref:ABC-2 type transport system permease protein n=1 Tax=Fontibacillus phaseoli TaxID=1416533 RepID=A0A369B824_9BACL|nr:ABC transporter permease [Fontibacillus phaseoli]RCX17682.1 ABC-2 type transport system permease protein [Fontibacillus phaseoli]